MFEYQFLASIYTLQLNSTAQEIVFADYAKVLAPGALETHGRVEINVFGEYAWICMCRKNAQICRFEQGYRSTFRDHPLQMRLDSPLCGEGISIFDRPENGVFASKRADFSKHERFFLAKIFPLASLARNFYHPKIFCPPSFVVGYDSPA